MKRIMVVIGIVVIVGMSALANPIQKNKKAHHGAFDASNKLVTAPREKVIAPVQKNFGIQLNMSQAVAVINLDVERLTGPKAKNEKNFRALIPTIEIGDFQLSMLDK